MLYIRLFHLRASVYTTVMSSNCGANVPVRDARGGVLYTTGYGCLNDIIINIINICDASKTDPITAAGCLSTKRGLYETMYTICTYNVRRVNNTPSVFIVSETVDGQKTDVPTPRVFVFNSTLAARDRETTLPS